MHREACCWENRSFSNRLQHCMHWSMSIKFYLISIEFCYKLPLYPHPHHIPSSFLCFYSVVCLCSSNPAISPLMPSPLQAASKRLQLALWSTRPHAANPLNICAFSATLGRWWSHTGPWMKLHSLSLPSHLLSVTLVPIYQWKKRCAMTTLFPSILSIRMN